MSAINPFTAIPVLREGQPYLSDARIAEMTQEELEQAEKDGLLVRDSVLEQITPEEMKFINASGLHPVECKVLVYPDQIEEKTSGGLYVPQTAKEKEQAAQVLATFIEAGGVAFEDWFEPTPKPGDRVYVNKYTGQRGIKGADGKEYWICNDKDILAIVEAE